MNLCQAPSVAVISLALTFSAHAEGLCAVKEMVIFNCELKRSVSSLCQSTENGTITYRNGLDGRINLQISGNNAGKKDVFHLSYMPYAGGGEAHIRFSRLDYTYYLYDNTIKTDEGPTFSAGIVIYRGEKKVSNFVCNNDASIRASAYESIVKEMYQEIDAH